MGKACILLVVLTILLSAAAAFGQDSRGGRRHRRSADHPSANGATRRADPETAAFLGHVDTNHNGMIDEDEVNQLGDFLKKTVKEKLTRLGIELKYPISLSQITVSPSASRHRRNRDSDSEDADSSSSDESSKDESATKPATNGFATTKPSLPTVPGFGQPNEQTSGEASSGAPSTPASAAASPRLSASAKSHTTPSAASDSSDESSDSPKRTGPKSGRFLTAKERLPKGLPEWFGEKDANGDGQVDMTEYARRWTPNLVEEFNRYDLNRDGVVTAAECLKTEHVKSK
jgi:hypothetical protein